MIAQRLLVIAALLVIGCDDPAIPVPVELEVHRGDGSIRLDSVTSVSFAGESLVVEGRIWFYCEDFSAVASQRTGDQREAVNLFIESGPIPEGMACNSIRSDLRYVAAIEAHQPVSTGPTAWVVRVYHRGKRVPVPPLSPAH